MERWTFDDSEAREFVTLWRNELLLEQRPRL
jgi:hypothetical protein